MDTVSNGGAGGSLSSFLPEMALSGIATSGTIAPRKMPASTIPSIDSLPLNLLQKIFSFLEAQSLGPITRLNKQWRNFTQSVWQQVDCTALFYDKKTGVSRWLSKMFRIKPIYTPINVQVIGPEEWKKCGNLADHGISVEEVPVLDKRKVISLLFRMTRSFNSVYRGLYNHLDTDLGFTVMLLPQGLTLNKIMALIGPENLLVNPTIRQGMGERVIRSSGWVILTNSLVPGSRNWSLDVQREEFIPKDGKMPTILSVVTLATVTEKISGKLLFPWKKDDVIAYSDGSKDRGVHTYTRCFEVGVPFVCPSEIRNESGYRLKKLADEVCHPIVVGRNSSNVLCVTYNPYFRIPFSYPEGGWYYNHTFESPHVGTGFLQEL